MNGSPIMGPDVQKHTEAAVTHSDSIPALGADRHNRRKSLLRKKKMCMNKGLDLSWHETDHMILCPSHVIVCLYSPPQKAHLLRAWDPAAWVRPVWVPICPRVATTRPITATISWRTTRPPLPRWPTSSSITTRSSSPAAPPPLPPPLHPHLPPLDSASPGWSGAFLPHWTMTCTFTRSVALM